MQDRASFQATGGGLPLLSGASDELAVCLGMVSLQARRVYQLAIVALACATVSTSGETAASAGDWRAVVLETDSEVFEGAVFAHNDQVCHLAARDGTLESVTLESVKKFRDVESRFRPLNVVDQRDLLRREYRGQLQVEAFGDFVVAAPPGQAAGYASLCDDTARSMSGFFSRRRFRLPESEFPLVVLVLRTRAEFDAYCEKVNGKSISTLQGFYHPITNRIALYDLESEPPDGPADPRHTNGLRAELRRHRGPPQLVGDRFTMTDLLSSLLSGAPANEVSVAGSNTQPGTTTRAVLMHEVVHQIAFNRGLHSRVGDNPRWLVEGLAMLFETEALRHDDRSAPVTSRINQERLQAFRAYQERRPKNSLGLNIANDEMFQTAALDAYAESWAVSFYLVEVRGSDYTRYLRKLHERDPLTEYTPTQRLADFQEIFGRDLARLEVDMLRYLDGLPLGPPGAQ